MLSHVLGENTQADRGEVVDRETRAFGVVFGEEALPGFLKTGLLETFCKHLEAELLLHLLEQDLDEDSRATGGILLVHMHDRERCPADAISGEEMAEEASDIAEAVGFVPVNDIVVIAETLLEVV